MKVSFFEPEGKPVSLEDILQPVIDENGGVFSQEEAVAAIQTKLRRGQLVMTPTALSIEQMVIGQAVTDWSRRVFEEGKRRFIADRKGNRADTRASQIVAMSEVQRQAFVQSARQFLFHEGPAAYRSQAQLLMLLDPSVDRNSLAVECGSVVREAVMGAEAEATEGDQEVA